MSKASTTRDRRSGMTPTAYDPGAVIRLGMFEGFRFLVVNFDNGTATISAAFMTRKAANKRAADLTERAQSYITGDSKPAIKVLPIDEAWDSLRHNMHSSWTVWLINHLMWYANIYGGEVDMGRVIGRSLAREHRTIQQSFMRMIRIAMEEYVKAEPGQDLRNEGALDWAHKVLELPHNMPLI